jgi:hypothetical protein
MTRSSIICLLIGLGCSLHAADQDVTAGIEAKVASLQQGSHPRIFADSRGFENLRQKIESDPQNAAIMKAIETRARKILDEKPVERIKKGRRILSVSRKALDRLLQLSMAARMTDDPAFHQRAIEEMEAIAAFTDWNPSHFLDTAEMTMAMAIGFDWLYDRIPEKKRQQFRNAIITLGLKPSLSQNWWWIDAENNWNQVCHGGMVAGALAIADHDPKLAVKIITRAIKNLPHSMEASYSPNGSYPEGVGYWNYGTTYNVLLIDMLQKALEDDFGLLEQPGFSVTGDYYHSAHTPMGRTFSYADSRWRKSKGRLSPTLFWLAKAFDRPDWLSTRIGWTGGDLTHVAGSHLAPLLLFWIQGATINNVPLDIPLDWEGKGHKPVGIHRSGWDPGDTYVGICAGSPSSNHGHMDIGSFVFESDCVTWAVDLGMQGYYELESQGIGLWESGQKGQRWDVFRLGPLSHNTVTINEQRQQVKSFAKVTSFSDNPTHPHSVVDMSATYEGQVGRLRRGIQLFNRSHLIVRDQLQKLSEDSEVRWAMTTHADIKIENPRRAILSEDGQTLIAHLIEPADAQWKVIDISKGPQPWDAENPGMQQLVFKHKGKKNEDMHLTVILETDKPGVPSPEQAKSWVLP